jgi:uncharacterized MAPEG superfamily protein
MTVELKYLAWTALLTVLTWIPYILNMITVRGLLDAVGYPADPKPLAQWAARMKRAHYNAIENLAPFAALVLVAHAAGIHNDATVAACAVFFWARLVHLVVYTLGVPWVRTLAFTVGFVCQVVLAWQILA